MGRSALLTPLLILLFTTVGPRPARSAVVFTEAFGAPGLATGWITQNNSSPQPDSDEAWQIGPRVTTLTSRSDDFKYASACYESAGAPPPSLVGQTATVSNWLISPQIAFHAGDVVSFWSSAYGNQDFPDRLQVRLNIANSGFDVGSTADSVGDFSTLLLDINPTFATTGEPGAYPVDWTHYTAVVPDVAITNPGRLAFRYLLADTSVDGNEIGIDDVTVSTVPEPGVSTLLPFVLLLRRQRRSVSNDSSKSRISFATCQRTRRSGFSLIELMVILGLIGVLTGLIVPGILGVRDRARVVQCKSNLRQLSMALLNYSSANATFPPNITFPSPGMVWYDPSRIGQYLGDDLATSAGKPGGSVFMCPADDGGERSYSMNIWTSSVAIPIGTASPLLVRGTCMGQSRVILLAESWSAAGSDKEGWFAPATLGLLGATPGQKFGAGGGIVPPMPAGHWGFVNSELAYNRHRQRGDPGVGVQALGRVQIAYADGHVELKSDRDLVDAESGQPTGDSLWYPEVR